MSKTLKFAPDLVPLVLSGAKTSTWRINDEKDLTAGDKLDLLYQGTGEKFAEAVIVKVSLKTIGKLSEEDKETHEKYASKKELYKTLEKYYNISVSDSTPVKVVNFKVTS